MKNKHINAFWIGFAFAAALTTWIYWLWRQKRVVAPEPLVVSRGRRTEAVPVAPPPPHVTAKQKIAVSDVLEEIKGIGPVFANRLNDAGIYTYEQLASSSPEELAQITGVTRWDPVDWIAEAARLAAS